MYRLLSSSNGKISFFSISVLWKKLNLQFLFLSLCPSLKISISALGYRGIYFAYVNDRECTFAYALYCYRRSCISRRYFSLSWFPHPGDNNIAIVTIVLSVIVIVIVIIIVVVIFVVCLCSHHEEKSREKKKKRSLSTCVRHAYNNNNGS